MNGMTAGAQDILERQYARNAACAHAHRELRSEFLKAAISLNPCREIATPVYERQKQQPLYEVIFDQLHHLDYVEFALLLLKVAHGEPITDEMRLSVNVMLAQIANRHADTHESVYADSMEG